ncbi:beta-phosphoglucomutase, partial [candidate division KSB1 bacterium 4484_188]
MPEFNFDAVIFDLDGVITQTASVHSSAWKQMFDEFLKAYSKQKGLPFRKFSHNSDYLPYVDGKPRYEGVASFLESRKINLPYGDPSDDPKKQTICGLGNVSFIKDLLKRNIKVAVASSSKNCKKILDAAGLTDLFETRVDGLVSAQLGLKGKPEPDIFATACENLGVTVDRAVVVEDAVSGVQAGRNGQFGLVLGIARENNRQELLANGADIVVTDLAEISLNDLENWFIRGLKEEQWTLSYPDYSQEKEA